jgi:hypothetical protein
MRCHSSWFDVLHCGLNWKLFTAPIRYLWSNTDDVEQYSELRWLFFIIQVNKRIFGPKREKVTGEWKKLHNEELNILYSSPISLGRWSQEECGRQLIWHAWERRENCIRFWWESQKKRDLLDNRGLDGRIGSQWILGRLVGRMLSGFDWLRIGASGGMLWMLLWLFGFWRQGVSWSVSQLVSHLVSQSLVSQSVSQSVS